MGIFLARSLMLTFGFCHLESIFFWSVIYFLNFSYAYKNCTFFSDEYYHINHAQRDWYSLFWKLVSNDDIGYWAGSLFFGSWFLRCIYFSFAFSLDGKKSI